MTMSESKVTIKDLPQDVLDEAMSFADPYFTQAIDKTFADMKGLGLTVAPDIGALDPQTTFAAMLVKRCFVRLAGEMVKMDRALKTEMARLREDLAYARGEQ